MDYDDDDDDERLRYRNSWKIFGWQTNFFSSTSQQKILPVCVCVWMNASVKQNNWSIDRFKFVNEARKTKLFSINFGIRFFCLLSFLSLDYRCNTKERQFSTFWTLSKHLCSILMDFLWIDDENITWLYHLGQNNNWIFSSIQLCSEQMIGLENRTRFIET